MGPAPQHKSKRSSRPIKRKTCHQLQVLQTYYQTLKRKQANISHTYQRMLLLNRAQITKVAQELNINRSKVYKWLWDRKKKDQASQQDIKCQIFNSEMSFQNLSASKAKSFNKDYQKESNLQSFKIKIEQQQWKQYEIDGIEFIAPESIYAPSKVIIPQFSGISQKGQQILRKNLWQFNPIERIFQTEKQQAQNFESAQKPESMVFLTEEIKMIEEHAQDSVLELKKTFTFGKDQNSNY